MRRGDLFLVERGARNDTKRQRVFLVVSRQPLIDSSYSTVICLMSIHKSALAHYVGSLSPAKTQELDQALRVALSLD